MPLPMFKQAKSEAAPALSEAKPKAILAVAAGKGGVGKSFVSLNLALSLKERGYQVGILDADIYGPSLRQMLPEDEMPKQKGNFFEPGKALGIPMMSMAFFREENQASIIRAPIAVGLIQQFMQQTLWGPLDFLIIDFPPGTGDIQLSLAQKANLTGAVMVTTPQQIAVLDVRKAIHMFEQLQVPVLGIVENMSYYNIPGTQDRVALFGEGGGEALASECGVPLLAKVPLDPVYGKAADLGQPLRPNTDLPVGKAFSDLTTSLLLQLKTAKQQLASFNRKWESMPGKKAEESFAAPSQDPAAITATGVEQEDAYHLRIHWADGQSSCVRLATIQRSCSCASCVDENTGVRREISVDPNVQARSYETVGRYGLRFDFTSGCQTGIYSCRSLRQLGQASCVGASCE